MNNYPWQKRLRRKPETEVDEDEVGDELRVQNLAQVDVDVGQPR